MRSKGKNKYKIYLMIKYYLVFLFVGYSFSFNFLMAQDLNENKNTKQEEKEKTEEVGKEDPTKDFRLLAVYLIGNEVRALIKDLSATDQSLREFKVGDFLDEEENIEVSRISINPTARVELIDRSGFGYLMRTQIGDIKAPSVSPKVPSQSKPVPTYFSGGKTSKQKGGKKKTDQNAQGVNGADEKQNKAKKGTHEFTELPKPDTQEQARLKQGETTGSQQGETQDQAPSQPPSQDASQTIQTTSITSPQAGSATATQGATTTGTSTTQGAQQKSKEELDLLSRPKSAYE